MAYLGGKARGADHILRVLNHEAFDEMHYLEPFVGYAHVLRRVERKASYRASDCNPLLVTLLRAIQDGKRMPHVTEEQYHRLRHKHGDTSLRRAVAAFTYTFGGKEWGGYIREQPRKVVRQGKPTTYVFDAEERKRYYARLRQNEQFRKCKIDIKDYRTLRPSNKLIYCDPPYAGTTGYNKNLRCDFDPAEFWETVRAWSTNNVVFVSEYRAPKDFACIASATKHSNISAPDLRVEKLFVHKSLLPLLPAKLRAKGRAKVAKKSRGAARR